MYEMVIITTRFREFEFPHFWDTLHIYTDLHMDVPEGHQRRWPQAFQIWLQVQMPI